MRWLLPSLLFIVSLGLGGCQQAPDAVGWQLASETVLSDGYGPECHASNLVKLPDGPLAAVWFSGQREGADDVVIRFSRQDASTGLWSRPITVADHAGIPCWNPVLFADGRGTLTLFYKVAKLIPQWEGWFRQSTDGGLHWSTAQRLPRGYLGPIRCHALPRPDGSVLFGSSTEAATGAKPWRVHFERCTQPEDFSLPAGWSQTTPADDHPALNAIQPSLLDHGNGHLVAYARTRVGVVARTESVDDGRRWSTLLPAQPPQANPNAGLEAVLLRDKSEVLILNPGKNRLQLDAVTRSVDGQNWQRCGRIDEVVQGEVSYPSALVETSNGYEVMHVCYTRNRREIVLRTFWLNAPQR